METAKSVDLAVLCWQWAIFPVRRQTSIFASAELNFCVRNGNRWTLCDNITNFARFWRTICISNELSSRFVAKQVFSPQQSLTSVFGMGTGGPSAIISLILSPNIEKELKNWDRNWNSNNMNLDRTKCSKGGSSPRSISISQLNALLHLHLWPIKLVVYKWPYSF